MPRAAAEAIVLSTRPVGEADLVVTFLTEAAGKLAGSAKSARKSRRRFGGALEPMTRGRAVWTEVEGRELVRPRIVRSAGLLRRDAGAPGVVLPVCLSRGGGGYFRARTRAGPEVLQAPARGDGRVGPGPDPRSREAMVRSLDASPAGAATRSRCVLAVRGEGSRRGDRRPDGGGRVPVRDLRGERSAGCGVRAPHAERAAMGCASR